MFLFILFTVIGVFVLVMAETLENKEGNDKEGLRIVKGVVIAVPLILGLAFMKPQLIMLSISIVVFKCIFTSKTKPKHV